MANEEGVMLSFAVQNFKNDFNKIDLSRVSSPEVTPFEKVSPLYVQFLSRYYFSNTALKFSRLCLSCLPSIFLKKDANNDIGNFDLL